jgi:hypothetical protein
MSGVTFLKEAFESSLRRACKGHTRLGQPLAFVSATHGGIPRLRCLRVADQFARDRAESEAKRR